VVQSKPPSSISSMPTKEELRQVVRRNLNEVISRLNAALRGEDLAALESTLTRLGRGGQLPRWYQELQAAKTLPNLDGKTVGSVVELLLAAVLETALGIPPLRINPARGVDLPDLDLGIKSPSENYCTSEPFFTAYERLLGSEHDALVLLTDYQQRKRTPPLKLQLIKWRYLTKSQIADESLCRFARTHREWLLQENESWAKKVFRFLAFVNQSDWRAKKLLALVANLQDESQINAIIHEAEADFAIYNKKKAKQDRPVLPDSDLAALRNILKIRPLHLGVIDAVDNWVVEVQKELGRLPNENEWGRLVNSPLDGMIGMSFAL
ncbi:MAG: hypothetical protein KA244_08920, partial [Deltaproteobacteria bacterium]|nr:hypothetical protein [Deltaproteobacteria bacterium]